ncbi:MAG: hypothetical protein NTU43_03780, partial [Bacteroidetes bacterium]|nr:hypothetical protein [Bacteroidota bacterium]
MILKNLLNKSIFAATLFLCSVNVFASSSIRTTAILSRTSTESLSLFEKIKLDLESPSQVSMAQVITTTSSNTSSINWLLLLVAILV